MTKSSEVLRLAAEYALAGGPFPVYRAICNMGWSSDMLDYTRMAGYQAEISTREHRCMALCLAAAIAEDAGD